MKLVLLFILSLQSFIALAQYNLNIPENDSYITALMQGQHPEFENDKAIIYNDKLDIELSTVETNLFNPNYSLTLSTQKLYKINDLGVLDQLTNINLPYSPNFLLKKVLLITYKMENGKLISTRFDKKDMVKEKVHNKTKILKLNLPSVTKGMFVYIAFTYQFELSPYPDGYIHLPWHPQEDFPVVNSYFSVNFPKKLPYIDVGNNVNFVNCNSIEQLDTSTAGRLNTANSSTTGFSLNTKTKIIWHRKNIKPIEEEDLIANIDDFAESVNFYMSAKHDLKNLWNDKGEPLTWSELNELEYFINFDRAFTPQDTFSTFANNIIGKPKNQLDSAKSIFKFVRDSIKNEGHTMKNRIPTNLFPINTFVNRRGSITHKNVLLITLLRQIGLSAVPVFISTKSSGKLNLDHYQPDKLNYVACALAINGETILLDASDKEMKFGMLRPYCYNKTAWLVMAKGAAININPNLLKEKYVCEATLDLQSDTSKYNLVFEQRFGNLSSYDLRVNKLTDSVNIKKELEKIAEKWPYSSKLVDFTITNADNADINIIVKAKYKIDIEDFSDLYYFNPSFKSFFSKNPLINASRKYPIQLGNCTELTYIVRLKLPKDVMIEDYAPSTQFNLEDGTAYYKSDTHFDPILNNLSMVSNLSIKESEYPVNKYLPLRSFFEKVIDEQNKKIILKKIKK